VFVLPSANISTEVERAQHVIHRIGKGVVNGRVCIVLSNKYLKSTYCMHELFDVWRNCREDDP
jgi:hypothetical protein